MNEEDETKTSSDDAALGLVSVILIGLGVMIITPYVVAGACNLAAFVINAWNERDPLMELTLTYEDGSVKKIRAKRSEFRKMGFSV